MRRLCLGRPSLTHRSLRPTAPSATGPALQAGPIPPQLSQELLGIDHGRIDVDRVEHAPHEPHPPGRVAGPSAHLDLGRLPSQVEPVSAVSAGDGDDAADHAHFHRLDARADGAPDESAGDQQQDDRDEREAVRWWPTTPASPRRRGPRRPRAPSAGLQGRLACGLARLPRAASRRPASGTADAGAGAARPARSSAFSIRAAASSSASCSAISSASTNRAASSSRSRRRAADSAEGLYRFGRHCCSARVNSRGSTLRGPIVSGASPRRTSRTSQPESPGEPSISMSVVSPATSKVCSLPPTT